MPESAPTATQPRHPSAVCVSTATRQARAAGLLVGLKLISMILLSAKLGLAPHILCLAKLKTSCTNAYQVLRFRSPVLVPQPGIERTEGTRMDCTRQPPATMRSPSGADHRQSIVETIKLAYGRATVLQENRLKPTMLGEGPAICCYPER